MGLNPLNLQLSVPRAPEISSIQQQAMNRPMTEQTLLEHGIAKETEEKRTQASAVDETEKGTIRDQEKDREGEASDRNKEKRRQKQELQEQAENHHPYKGHKLDIRL